MNPSVKLLLISSLCLAASAAWAQGLDGDEARLRVSENIRVGADLPQTPHVEPVIAINPHDPDHFVAASIVVEEPFAENWTDSWRVHVLVSRDRGNTWTRQRLPLLAEHMAGDPWLAWGSDGTLYFSCLVELIGKIGDRHMRAVVFRSDDGGQSWSEPVDVFPEGRSYDHPVLSVAGGNDQTSAYVFATGSPFGAISISGSHHDGKDFSPLPRYQPDTLNNNLGSGAALPDGGLVFSYYSMSRPQPSPLWAVRSADGSTYDRTVITREHIPVGFPMMAVDRSSGARRGRIYSVWTRSDARPHVMLTLSDDGGASWSEPVRVHRDASVTLRTLPNIAVNDAGRVAVAWIDGRHHEGDCWDVYATTSLDGGSTFLPEVRLTAETTCPNATGNGGAGRRWRWGGDYIGITTNAEGSFYVIWSDSRTGVYQNWMTRVDVEGRSAE